MKILMINKFLHANGGSETYVIQLGQYLSEQGHEVEYFGMDHPERILSNRLDLYTKNMDFHGGKLQKLLYPFKIIYSFEARKKMAAVLKDFNPDVVHVNNFNFQLTPSILYAVRAYERKVQKKIRIIYTAHDSQLVCPNHLMYNQQLDSVCTKCMETSVVQCSKYKCIHGSMVKSMVGTFEARWYRMVHAYRMFDAIIAPSHFLAERLLTYPDLKERIHVLPNFLSMSKKLEELQIPEKESYVLYFGRYSAEKGIDFLIEVCKELPEISFRFAGAGPLEDLLSKVSNVENVGFRTGDDLQQLIAGAQFSMCTSSCYENCPYSILESQYLGTPVIGTNQGGIPELIELEQTGMLYEPKNAEDLKDKIQKMWYNKQMCNEMSKTCLEKKFWELEGYVEQLVNLYKGE